MKVISKNKALRWHASEAITGGTGENRRENKRQASALHGRISGQQWL
jgi:hypothetical protein